MIKAFYIILFVQIFIFGCNADYGQVRRPDSIKIEFEGFYTETIVDINCDAFASTFKETKKSKVLRGANDLSKFELLERRFKPTKSRSLDVRGSITYTYRKNINKYCFDVFGYFYNDGKFFYNKNLLMAISDKVYNNHPKYLDTLRQQ